ncbi:hypothetical protein JCM8547_005568 [Rhodosporidiobolus lusitaniae]
MPPNLTSRIVPLPSRARPAIMAFYRVPFLTLQSTFLSHVAADEHSILRFQAWQAAMEEVLEGYWDGWGEGKRQRARELVTGEEVRMLQGEVHGVGDLIQPDELAALQLPRQERERLDRQRMPPPQFFPQARR